MSEINLALFKKQLLALKSKATEILYGGAAGGGKSHLMRIAAIVWVTAIPGLQVYLFRRLRDDLIKTHLDSPKGFRNILAPWVDKGWVKIKEDVITFWNGSRIYLCHCQHETDVAKYLSAEIHVLLIDELTTFSENMYRQLRARVRMVGIKVPKEYEEQFPRILCGSNPGNVGHLFVKGTFVDDVEPLKIVKAPSAEGGMMRQYIPAKVNDNPALLLDDPTYVDKLKGIGSEALVRAMLNGDWNIVEGAFFDCWSEDRHVVKPFQVPEHWMRFLSGDWGSAKPFSFGWWAVVSDPHILPDGRVMPRGALVRYKEWYGSRNHNDVGLKLDAEVVGGGDSSRGIIGLNERCKEKLAYSVLDPAAFSNHGGPSIAERIFKAGGPFFIRADNKRIARKGAIGGWDTMRGRLVGDDDGNAMMFIFSTCVDTVRTVPAMQHDQNNAEDLLTTGEDHICFSGDTLVDTDKGQIPISELKGGKVWSIGGLQDFTDCRLTQKDAKLIKLTFDDGTEVKCTPNHKFMSHNGLKPARLMLDETSYGYELCNQSKSAILYRNTKVSVITFANTISKRTVLGFTGLSSKTIMGIYQRVCTSITKTMTSLTTPQAIFPALQRKNIVQSIGQRSEQLNQEFTSTLFGIVQKNGTAQKKDMSGIKNIGKNILNPNSKIKSPKDVLSAALTTKSPVCRKTDLNTVILTVKPRLCVNVEEIPNADVYCLTVPKTQMFSVAGGLLVHNCDEIRYACMSRPYVVGMAPTHINDLHQSTFNETMRANNTKTTRNQGYI